MSILDFYYILFNFNNIYGKLRRLMGGYNGRKVVIRYFTKDYVYARRTRRKKY